MDGLRAPDGATMVVWPCIRGTLQRLSQVARSMSDDGVTVGPLQVAALLLEQAVAEATTISFASRHSEGSGGSAPEHGEVAAQANQRQRKTHS